MESTPRALNKTAMEQWQPTSNARAWRLRANLYRQIRAFFDQREVLEVDTPQLAQYGVTELHVDCIPVAGYGYLQSSPEYHMKRLLAAGSGAIWQLCKSFRHGEAGKRHNPEFTMLEWYRPGFYIDDLIAEVVALLHQLLPARKVVQRTFRDAFADATGIDPLQTTASELEAHAHQQGGELPQLNLAGWVDWLMATEVEASFDPAAITVITDFPAWAAALAEVAADTHGEPVAQRFEVYSGGLELANGYQELRDPQQQAARFNNDRELRRAASKPDRQADHYLLAALAAGLPSVSGVALGIERLLMVISGTDDIASVLTFPQVNA